MGLAERLLPRGLKEPPRPELNAVREQLLHWLLVALSVLGLPTVTAAAIKAGGQGDWAFSIAYVSLYLLFPVNCLLLRRAGFQFRVYLLLGGIFVICAAATLRLGLSSDGMILFVSLCLLASVFLGARVGIMTIAACTLTCAGIAGTILAGHTRIQAEHLMTSFHVIPWITALLLLVTVTTLIVVATHVLRMELEDSLVKLEARVRERTSELEVANEELQAFTSSVSHDLRAPLRAITGFGALLVEDCGDRLDDQGRQHADRIVRAAERMERLIADLMELSRVSRLELNREAVDLSAISRKVALQLQTAEPDRVMDLEIQEDLRCTGDPSLLRIVMANLIGNSWKFTRDTARAQIEIAELEVEGERAFLVRDNGAGFDMEFADKLFQEFQRLHNVRDFEGTGVGLATVRRIIHRHGGRVWAEGREDQGAVFFFTLPDA